MRLISNVSKMGEIKIEMIFQTVESSAFYYQVLLSLSICSTICQVCIVVELVINSDKPEIDRKLHFDIKNFPFFLKFVRTMHSNYLQFDVNVILFVLIFFIRHVIL